MKAFGEKRTTKEIFLRALKTTWDQFAIRTTIHGVRYINDPNGNIYTKSVWSSLTFFSTHSCTNLFQFSSRFLWIGLCSAALITSFSLLGTFVHQFKTNPTRVNVQSSHVPINQLPFPGVTFCNIKRIHSSRANELIDSL